MMPIPRCFRRTFVFGFLLMSCCCCCSELSDEVDFNDDNFLQIGSDIHQDKNGPINVLDGKHLMVIPWSGIPSCLNAMRNSSGHIVNVTGTSAVIFQELANSLHFTFEYYPDNDVPVFAEDQSPEKPGVISLLKKTEADVALGSFAYTEKRNRLIDYPCASTVGAMALMIPKPTVQKSNHLYAIFQPFEPEVWLYLLVAVVVGASCLYAVSRIVSRMIDLNELKLGTKQKIRSEYLRFRMALSYIFSLLLMQGSFASGEIKNGRQLAVRIVTGAWCLTCFILVTAYSSVLLASLIAPDKFAPIVKSVNDLPMKPDIGVTVNKGLFADVLFQAAVKDDKSAKILKYLGEELNHHPENRCPTTDQCVEQVRKGSSVYIYVEDLVMSAISDDWKKNGRCDLTVAKEKFIMILASILFLQKDSQYSGQFKRQLAIMDAAGLLGKWERGKLIENAVPCLRKIQQETNDKKRKDDKKRLTLEGLSGAFLVLGVGYIISVFAFIIEIVWHWRSKIRRQQQTLVVRRQPSPIKDNKVETAVENK